MLTNKAQRFAAEIISKERCLKCWPVKDGRKIAYFVLILNEGEKGRPNKTEKVDPFYKATNDSNEELAKECLANRQADVIEDYLLDKHIRLFTATAPIHVKSNSNANQWRLDRIEYCLNKLAEVSNER